MADMSVLTARQAVDRIIQYLGVPRRDQTVDVFLAGDPATPVRGIATTMMATMDVLQRCVANGSNLVVSHEPAFWDHRNEAIDALRAEQDPIYHQKLAYIDRFGLVIWHLHDALHDMRPDLVDVGTLKRIGWPIPHGCPAIIDIPRTRLADLVAQLARRLNASSARFIGQPDLPVDRVGLALGFRGSDNVRHLLQDDTIDAVLIGEAHEWEVGAYAADAVTLGAPKALVVLGHIPSEQYGMAEATEVIKRALPTIPVTFVPCRDPYWPADQI